MGTRTLFPASRFWLFLVAMACVGTSARGEANWKAVQQERLAKYAFVRTDFDPGALGYLIGNAELGGMAAVSGLAIPKVFGADLWKNEVDRKSVDGPGLACAEFAGDRKPVTFRQALGLADGVVRTRAIYAGDTGYEAEIFCSMESPHLVVLRVRNLGGAGERAWTIVRPGAGYAVTRPEAGMMVGQNTNQSYTHDAWAIRASKAWTSDAGGRERIMLAPNETVTLVYSCTTQWDGADHVAQCGRAVSGKAINYKRQETAHSRAWAALWAQSATLVIPDETLEKMWYRSLFWTLSTCGSERFHPGECMFAVDCWGMRPFTYGAAGWAVLAYTAAGFQDRARTMLDWFYKPDVLQENARYYVKRLAGRESTTNAWAFAHEVRSHGQRNPCDFWELQRHVDGFAATLFYRYNRFYPDAEFGRKRVYPVLRGVSSFYQEMATLDSGSGQYILPKMTSLTEDLSATNPIDAALAAKWTLVQASRMAEDLKVDDGPRESWKALAAKLCIPGNDARYLEYFGDQEKRPGGGYQGVRGFVYLSYPTLEIIPQVDRDKAIRTLDYTWDRNNHGDGMISFVANWFSLADIYFGRGEHALTVMQHNLKCMDRWGISVRETPSNDYYYFADGYLSFILVPLAMAVQSSDDHISVFPAVPSAWKNFSFYNVPAESGIRVSGEMKDGKVQWVSYKQGKKELLRLKQAAGVRVQHDGRTIRLKAE